MSLNSKIVQACPHCQTEQEMEYYRTVNVTLHPELKAKVISGKLNSNLCSHCKKEIEIVSGLLYHDMEKRLMIELAFEDEGDEGEPFSMIEDLVSKGYIYRKVNEYGRLVEKIQIFDNKLNDFVVDKLSNKMKEMLDESIKQVGDIKSDYHFTVVFKKIENSLFKKKISFYCFSNPRQMMEMSYGLKNLSKEERKELYNIDGLRK